MSKRPQALDYPDERGDDLRRGDADLDEAPDAESVRVKELLDALRQEHSADKKAHENCRGRTVRIVDPTEKTRGR